MEDFKWTDELVKEYVHRTFAPCDPNHTFMEERMVEFKKSKKQPLFYSEDGKEIFEDNECWYVRMFDGAHTSKWDIGKSKFKGLKAEEAKRFKFFSTEEKAKEYVIDNRPCLSFRDICGLWIIDKWARERLKDLVKQKTDV